MSEEKKYINIEIGSRNIKLASEESDEYLRAIAKYLNQKMADITGGDLSHPYIVMITLFYSHLILLMIYLKNVLLVVLLPLIQIPLLSWNHRKRKYQF